MSENLLPRIKQIRTDAGLHEIDAKFVNGRPFEDVYKELQGMAHGVIDTYVIPLSNKGKDGYDTVVESVKPTEKVSISVLNGLVKPENASKTYKVGDVILMEEVSDGTKIFDRWVSEVSENEVTLSILETQVATHHHEITSTTGSAITSVSATEYISVPTVGDAVNVLTAASDIEVITSIAYSDNPDSDGGHTFAVATATSSDEGAAGHTHTISAHGHSANFTPTTIVSETVSVYADLSEATHTVHTHDSVEVAGVATEDSSNTITFIKTGVSDTFIKTLTEDSTATTTSATVSAEGVSLSTVTQTSDDVIGDDVKTKDSGAHDHTVSGKTTTDVVTEVSLAPTVITSVSLSYVAPSVQEAVVTNVTYTSTSFVTSVDSSDSKFFNSCSVDESGVLSFGSDKALTSVTPRSTTLASEITVTSASQSAGSATISAPSAVQTYVSGIVDISGATSEDGSHSHGFSHTHTIAEHTHEIGAHSHTYVKTGVGESGEAITSLTSDTYVPHTHEEKSVAAVAESGSTLTYITGGSKVDVVGSLLSTDVNIVVEDSAELTTDTKYYKITGDIEFPGLSFGTTTLTKTTVTPAVATESKAIKTITTTSGEFVNSIDELTTVNIGGDVKKQ